MQLRTIGTYFTETISSISVKSAAIAFFLLTVVSLFLVELPTWLLDILLVINITMALTLLLRSIMLEDALRLYSFPAILMLTTVFRLALNISSTKLILLRGDAGLDAAGEVIEAFGTYVAGGDFIVGAIIFGIIATVNFLVIAKGSARVAEVSARFTLDALPGRQLSIDSELRAGNITPRKAAQLRSELSRESRFFGAMDGAMKWVQGDAIAGLAITFINSLGGVALGVGRGMPFADAVSTFGILTIGDGLVSILPSLLISVSAGIVVTHVASEEKHGSADEMLSQVFSDPKGPAIAAVFLLSTGLLGLTGLIDLPALPLLVVGVLMVAMLSAYAPRISLAGATATAAPAPVPRTLLPGPALAQLPDGEDAQESDFPEFDELAVVVDGRMLAPYLGIASSPAGANGAAGSDTRRTEEFNRLTEEVRERVFKERGVVLPLIQLRADRALGVGCYEILVREQVVRRGQVRTDQLLVVGNQGLLSVFGFRGIETARHPVDHRAAAWIPARQAGLESLAHLGVEILNPASFLIYEAVGGLFQVIDEVFGLNEVKSLLQGVEGRNPQLAAEVLGNSIITLPELTELLRRLVRERVNIRDVKLILEGIAEFAATHTVEDRQEWLAELHSFLRMVLSRGIINDAVGPGDKLRTFILSSEIEDEFRSAVAMWDQGRAKPPLDPAFESSLRANATRIFTPVLERGAVPIVILCPGDIRPAVQDFFSRYLTSSDWVRTIAYQELRGQYRPEAIGVLNVSY